MYDLNRFDEIQTLFSAPGTAPKVDPAAEFRARLQAITPDIFIARILVGMNVVIFLAMILSGVPLLSPTVDNMIHWGADFGPRTIAGGEWWRLLMSMFLHVGIVHLAFNMFVLWQIGPFVERLLGNLGFLIVYFVSGVAAAFVSLVWRPYLVSAGASGAIFGLYGALLGFLSMRRDSIPSEVLSPLTKNALIFLGYNAVYGFMRSGTDVAAHLGGLAAGFVCGLCLSVPLTASPLPGRDIRNVAVALGSIALFIGTAFTLPRPVDIQAELQRFAAVEKKTMAAYATALSRTRGERLRDEQLADLIEKDVVPDWVIEHDKLAALKGLTGPPGRVLSLLVQ